MRHAERVVVADPCPVFDHEIFASLDYDRFDLIDRMVFSVHPGAADDGNSQANDGDNQQGRLKFQFHTNFSISSASSSRGSVFFDERPTGEALIGFHSQVLQVTIGSPVLMLSPIIFHRAAVISLWSMNVSFFFSHSLHVTSCFTVVQPYTTRCVSKPVGFPTSASASTQS